MQKYLILGIFYKTIIAHICTDDITQLFVLVFFEWLFLRGVAHSVFVSYILFINLKKARQLFLPSFCFFF